MWLWDCSTCWVVNISVPKSLAEALEFALLEPFSGESNAPFSVLHVSGKLF